MAEETETTSEQNDATLATAADAVSTAVDNASDAIASAATKVKDAVVDAVTSDDADDAARSSRKVREGTVVSNKMDKTAVVAVVSRVPHAKYQKMILQTTKLYAHDETNDVNIGDKVRVMETRALSKKKRWRVIDVLERAK